MQCVMVAQPGFEAELLLDQIAKLIVNIFVAEPSWNLTIQRLKQKCPIQVIVEAHDRFMPRKLG